jgi:hypothetical protein
MVRNATFWVVGMWVSHAAFGPGGNVIFSGGGAGGNLGMRARKSSGPLLGSVLGWAGGEPGFPGAFDCGWPLGPDMPSSADAGGTGAPSPPPWPGPPTHLFAVGVPPAAQAARARRAGTSSPATIRDDLVDRTVPEDRKRTRRA